MRHDELAWNVVVAFWTSRGFSCLCMLALQYLLVKIHRLRKLLAPEAIPTVSEIWVGVAVFWMGQLILTVLANGILDVTFSILSNEESHTERRSREVVQLSSIVFGAIRILVDRVVVSWTLHHSLVLLLDIIIPFSKNRRQNTGRQFTRLLTRAVKLVTFIHHITFGSPPTTTHVPLKILIQDNNSSSTTQTVRLQRIQTDHPNEGQRNLAWNLVVDKEALDEMKQTLGPPGGFGELGFSVGRDGVRFEAMGVGTSFVLDFEVAAASEGRVATVRRKTK